MSNIFPAKSALIALSGGVDSAVLLAKAKEAGVVLHAATVISEFTPTAELKAAEELAARLMFRGIQSASGFLFLRRSAKTRRSVVTSAKKSSCVR
ncbi:MAG: 7-cyano-7-deazaguanine synthase [Methanocorpusculum sp.]|nr:7-cyano-7-deazaguanine synthase [Methanocorpusculum sp.]